MVEWLPLFLCTGFRFVQTHASFKFTLYCAMFTIYCAVFLFYCAVFLFFVDGGGRCALFYV